MEHFGLPHWVHPTGPKMEHFGDPQLDFLGTHKRTFWGATIGLFGGSQMDFLGCYKWTFLGATNGLFRLQKMDFFAIKNGTPGVPGVAFTLEITVCFTHPGKNFSKFRGKTSPFFGVNKWTFWGLTNGLFGDSQMDFFGCYKWTFWGLTNGLFWDPQMDFLGYKKRIFGGPTNGLFGAGQPGRQALLA